MFRIRNPGLAVPSWIMFYGSALSLLLSSAIRMLFPPPTNQLQGVNAPALWLKRAGAPAPIAQGTNRIAKYAFAVAAVAIAGSWIAGLPPHLVLWLGASAVLIVLFAAYQLWKQRG